MSEQKQHNTDFFAAFWKAALAVGGLGTVGAFLLWDLYKTWFTTGLAGGLFSRMNEDYTFILMLVFLVLVFFLAALLLAAFVSSAQKKTRR